jgi:hypothetical protein
MDEVVLTIRGQKHYLWRAVDQDGNVLDILVQSRRNKLPIPKGVSSPLHQRSRCSTTAPFLPGLY